MLGTTLHEPARPFGRRHVCLCRVLAAQALGVALLTPREAFAQAKGIVDTIRDAAASPPVEVHRPRGGVVVLQGSGDSIAVLAGEMLVTVRDSIAALKRQGRRVKECVAAGPTRDFDAWWGQYVLSPAFFTRVVHMGV